MAPSPAEGRAPDILAERIASLHALVQLARQCRSRMVTVDIDALDFVLLSSARLRAALAALEQDAEKMLKACADGIKSQQYPKDVTSELFGQHEAYRRMLPKLRAALSTDPAKEP